MKRLCLVFSFSILLSPTGQGRPPEERPVLLGDNDEEISINYAAWARISPERQVGRDIEDGNYCNICREKIRNQTSRPCEHDESSPHFEQ